MFSTHDDGVVNDQSNGRRQAAQCHEIKALVQYAKDDEGNGDGGWDNQARHYGGAPVAQEQNKNGGGENKADEDGVAHAGDGIIDQIGLIVEGRKTGSRRQGFAQVFDGRDALRWPPRRCCCRVDERGSAAQPAFR